MAKVRVSPKRQFGHNSGMHAYVYKSQRKADTYVYLSARDDFACLPEPLRAQMGVLQFVLDVELTPQRQLAREDAGVVRQNLVERGFHLQFPPGNVFAATLPHAPTGERGND